MDNANDNPADDGLTPELRELGARAAASVASDLPVPDGLAARTLARIRTASAESLSPAEQALGAQVAALPAPEAPADLAARTLARVQASRSARQTRSPLRWLLRPITNPVARAAAAALIVLTIYPVSDFNRAANLGALIEQHILGPKLTDRAEGAIDTVLLNAGLQGDYSQSYLEAFAGLDLTPPPQTRRVSRATPPKRS